MDSKIFISTFLAIFLAELGDKTQLVALAASAQSKSTFSIWLAVVLALGLAGTLGVFAGKLLSQFINPSYLRTSAAFLFIIMGVLMLWKR